MYQTDLASKKCVPCEGGVKPFSKSQAEVYLTQAPGWQLGGNLAAGEAESISRQFKFKNYKSALEFVNKVSEIAESEGHHPDLKFGWGYVDIKSSTHTIKGLSENDFILAAKINQL